MGGFLHLKLKLSCRSTTQECKNWKMIWPPFVKFMIESSSRTFSWLTGVTDQNKFQVVKVYSTCLRSTCFVVMDAPATCMSEGMIWPKVGYKIQTKCKPTWQFDNFWVHTFRNMFEENSGTIGYSTAAFLFFRVSLNLNWFLGLYTSSHSNGVGQFVWSKALPFPVTQDGPLNQRKTSCVKSRPTPAFHSVKSQGDPSLSPGTYDF